MDIQKINWKIFFDQSSQIDPPDFFKVFNTWIPNSPEIFVDVADYQHVHDGPLTLLVGYSVDYALDARDRRMGFHYSSKKPVEGDNATKLARSLDAFLKACKRLTSDEIFKGKLKFKRDELLFFIHDRGVAPNTQETGKTITPLISDLFDKKVGKGNFKLEPETNSKKLFNVKISLSHAI